MKEIRNRDIEINGVNEKVLRSPKSRTDLVTITQGGMSEHATEVALDEFERLTGYYFKGLEPTSDKALHDELERLRVGMTEIGFEVKDAAHAIISGGVSFVTSNNLKFAVIFRVNSNVNDNYEFSIRKVGRYGSSSSMSSFAKNMENVVDNLLDMAKQYTSTMTQNLTMGIKEMENKGPQEREYSHDGVPVLFPNETLTDYFKKNKVPAGMVVNGKDRYQVFHTYINYGGELILHYDTKDYANKKNASKALLKMGYSPEGKQLPVLDVDSLKENVVPELSRRNSASWGDDKMAYFSVNEAHFTVSNILSREDEILGTQYYVDVTLQNRMTGHSVTHEVSVDPRDNGNPHAVLTSIESKSRAMLKDFKDANLIFGEDTRTNDEKMAYHQSQYNSHKRMIQHYETQLSKNENPFYEKNATESLQWEKMMFASHIDKQRELESSAELDY